MLARLRSSRLLRLALALIAIGFVAYGLASGGDQTLAALGELSWWSIAGAYLAVLAGLLCMLAAWRSILRGLGTDLPVRQAARVMFVGQLGKYVPGSVWAYAAMMELGRDHACPPRRMFGSVSIAIVVSLGCALSVAAATLGTQGVFRQAWYLLALIPLIAVGLHPRVLTWGLNLALRIARREPLDMVLPGRAVLVAVAWTTTGWLIYGVHLLLLAPGAAYPLASGAYALAWATGIITVVVPAGIGVREGAMVIALAPTLAAPEALVAAAVSRVVFTVADVSLAAAGWLAAQPLSRRSA
ncbi:lysylphosphatidylglycerol synthase domain-containing protein [Spongiactinospora sp. TRM90649]|uniref:lysylphosphatidylglycerol synthase domain-containing protein n=1 Tax=Spongiactinospora sp. TRM90649 TaxID=3031114 RepID=UPI0023F89E74|nr:lysylphosphatidylglycerol synthase domain-containing protein [Spongiactinospora sp. TRM90649]MDF5751182.1 lysylphosphatidylglycerol synthase domain-containing protein [Spongiactinospora sp. TRM90649]